MNPSAHFRKRSVKNDTAIPLPAAGKASKKVLDYPGDQDTAKYGGGGDAQYRLQLVVVEVFETGVADNPGFSHRLDFFLHDATPD